MVSVAFAGMGGAGMSYRSVSLAITLPIFFIFIFAGYTRPRTTRKVSPIVSLIFAMSKRVVHLEMLVFNQKRLGFFVHLVAYPPDDPYRWRNSEYDCNPD
jgi:hypothetical protein